MGHFAIVLSACMMYSPFFYQTAIGLVYIISAIMMLVFEAWKYERLLMITVTCKKWVISSVLLMHNWADDISSSGSGSDQLGSFHN